MEPVVELGVAHQQLSAAESLATANFVAEFTGGVVNTQSKIITTVNDATFKQITLSFFNQCPGSGWDPQLATVVRLSAACSPALQNAVNSGNTVRLEATKSGINLTNVNHFVVP